MNFNNTLRNITAVVAFGVFGIAMSPATHAGAMYSADASVAITSSPTSVAELSVRMS